MTKSKNATPHRTLCRVASVSVLPISMLYYEILLRLFGSAAIDHLVYPIFYALTVGILLSALAAVLKPKLRRIYILIVQLLTAVVYIIACLMHSSFQVYMAPDTILKNALNVVGNYGGELGQAILHGAPVILAFLVPAILFAILGRFICTVKRCRFYIALLLLVVGAAGFATTCFVGQNISAGRVYKSGSFDNRTSTFGLIGALWMNAGPQDTSNAFVLENTPATPATSTEPAVQTETFGEPKNDTPAPLNTASPELQPTTAETESSTVPQESETHEEESPVVYGQNIMELDLDTLMDDDDDVVASISSYVDSLTASSQNKYTGLFSGKNLILITAEAFCDSAVNPELTPTLYRLTHNGIYFSDFYQPTWCGSTSSGEFSLIFGIAPMDAAESMYTSQYNNNYFTMGNQLQRLGYYSAAFHNGTDTYYDRNLTHENLGYSDWIAFGSGLEDLVGDDEADTTMFDATLDTYIDEQPFSVYYMTISGHAPYVSSSEFVDRYYDEVKAYYGNTYPDTVLYYFCFQKELDNALEVLIDRLEDAGIADNTVICMTGDHYPYGLQKSDTFFTDYDYLYDLFGDDYDDYNWNIDHNAAVIWSGCLENELKDYACEVSDPCYSLDLLPTLSNLFGLEYDSRLLVGRDVFSDEDALVLWLDFSWATRYGRYDAARDTFYPNAGYESYNNAEYITHISNVVSNKMNYSELVVDYDYFGVLFGEDDCS